MIKKTVQLFALSLLQFGLIQWVTAQDMEIASPDSLGFNVEALDRATESLQQHIANGEIAGVVAAVARDGKLVYFESLGQMNLELNKPMQDDALFRLYSMSRQITSVAVLQLYEQGKFQFDDPIKMYLPDFEAQRVLIDSSSTDLSQTKRRTGDITVAQLLTHTSGLGSRSSALYRQNNVRDKNNSLEKMVANAARIPLFQDPGTEFRYGIHATILGKLIELWSGQPFEEYLQKNLFEPLAMHDTMFWAEGSDAERIAELYRPSEGQLKPYQIESVPWTARPKLIEGGVGLLSSVMDYMHFTQMVLNGGTFNGKQLLQPETAKLMYENAVPEQAMPIGSRGYWLGSGWTLGGFNLVMDPDAYDFPVSAGTIWWDGSAGTRYFVDPVQGTIIIIMAQVSPSSGGGFREDFSRLIDAALVDRR